MSRRKIQPDELELWHKVTQTTERLFPGKPEPGRVESKSEPKARPGHKPDRFDIGEKAEGKVRSPDVLPGLPERMAAAPVKMDRKAFGRLKRGKLKPEAKIDLHGMTVDQAHPALTGFILRAQAQGKRLVLVITGKGKDRDDGGPIPVRLGVLRHNVPHWLSVPPLAQLVLQVSEAHVKHGGGGAYYVYLRRNR